MKSKFCVLLAITLGATAVGGALAQSSPALQAAAQSEHTAPEAAERTAGESFGNLRISEYEDAINDAKRVLSTSSDVHGRARAYKLLITAVRVGEGYDAAIRRAYGALAYAKKTGPLSSVELACLKNLISDLRRTREEYLKTVAEQQRIIKAHAGTPRAGEAALRIAECRRYLGPQKSGLAAYEEVARGYALTRPGWKAAQEAAWLKQQVPRERPLADRRRMESSDGRRRVLEDGLRALREGRAQDAEKLARNTLASRDRDREDEIAALEVLVRAIAARLGYREASKQAWQIACGTEEFKPTYSDVLRLEAIVAELATSAAHRTRIAQDRDEASSETVSEANENDDHAGGSEESRQVAEAQQDTRRAHSSPSRHAVTTLPTMAAGGLPLHRNQSPTFIGSPVLKPAPTAHPTTLSEPKEPVAAPADESALVTPVPLIPIPAEPQPVRPGPIPIPSPAPPNPRLDRWACDSQYRNINNDEQAIRDLMKEHLSEAARILFVHAHNSHAYRFAGLVHERRRAVGIALTAAIWASDRLADNDLAMSICSRYLMPNLNAAHPERWDYLSQEAVVSAVISVWQKADEVEKVIDLYEWWIARDDCANSADANRIRLAEVFAGQERYEEAIRCLRQIDDNGDCAGAKSMITELEAKLKEQRSRVDSVE